MLPKGGELCIGTDECGYEFGELANLGCGSWLGCGWKLEYGGKEEFWLCPATAEPPGVADGVPISKIGLKGAALWAGVTNSLPLFSDWSGDCCCPDPGAFRDRVSCATI